MQHFLQARPSEFCKTRPEGISFAGVPNLSQAPLSF
jgi:hypothetical protein